MKIQIIVFLVSFLITLPCFAEKRKLTVDDFFSIPEVSEPQISPDGGWIAFVKKTRSLKEDQTNDDICMVSTKGGEPIQLTRSPKKDSHPRWSPDGRYLAFLSKREKKPQVFLLSTRGGEAMQLTNLKQEISDLIWSPDSKKLALIISDIDPYAIDDSEKKEGEEKTAKPIVITRRQFKRDEIGYLTEVREHLYTLDVETKQLKQLTSGQYDDTWPRWSPDGKQILFVSNRTEDPDSNQNTDLFLVPADGGELKRLTENLGTDDRPEWSADGKWIVYQTMTQPNLIWYDTVEVAVLPAEGGNPKILTRELDRNGFAPKFSSDGKQVYFRLEDRGTEKIAAVSLDGKVLRRDIAGEAYVSDFTTAKGAVAFIAGRPHLPEEVFFLSENKARQMTSFSKPFLDSVHLGTVERISFQSKDGTPVEGFVVKPPDFDSSKKYPLILDIHGGPTSQYAESFDFEWQLYAASGYVVVGVNPRGSTGYGEDFTKAIWADWGNKDYEDVMAGVDHVIAQGYIDPERMGVGGWSYGGMLTDVVITKTTRFKAATSGASIAMHFAGYGTDHYQYEWEMELGLPWEKESLWRDISPYFQITKVKTPTLFLCGQEDWNVPLINSELLYQALRRLGIDTMLIVYPGQSHAIVKPSYIKDRWERYLAWFGHYVKGEPNRVPAAAK